MMLTSTSIGQKITMARKKKNLSQAELGMKISISAQAVGKWERGESLPDITTLNRIAEILEVDLNYFSEKFNSGESKTVPEAGLKKEKTPGWNMSELCLKDSDFSGLKNLHEKLNATIIQNCNFTGSDLSHLELNENMVENCDFSKSKLNKSKIKKSLLNRNNFSGSSFKEAEIISSPIGESNFSDVDFSKTTFRSGFFTNNKIKNAVFKETTFYKTGIQEITFEGNIENCVFEDCAFYKVKFSDSTLRNTFFKNNKKFNRVQFINCKADKITYAFLKNNLADLSGITLTDE